MDERVMEKYSFQIEKLSIRKIPGFPEGLRPYEQLSPQINIIAGPNASGKSTTARAIQKLIWRDHTEGVQIEGQIDIGEEAWAIRIDSKHAQVQRQGKGASLNGLPAAEDQDRYMLALHDLIGGSEEELAGRIIQESIGGLDLDEAQSQLGYSDHVKPSNTGEYKTYEEAAKTVKNQTSDQQELVKQQQRLAELKVQKEEAEEAAKLTELYEQVVEYLKASRSFHQQKKQLDEFPSALTQANGDEDKRLKKLERKIGKAVRDIQEAKTEMEMQQQTISELKIPRSGVPDEVVTELEERVETLQNLSEAMVDHQQEQKEQQQHRAVALANIDEKIDPSEWEGLNLADIQDLSEFLLKAQQTAGTKRFLKQAVKMLEDEQTEEDGDLQTLQKGIDALSHWLKEPQKNSLFPSWTLPVIILIAILTVVAGLTGLEIGWVGGVIILILAGYGWLKHKQKGPQPNKKIRKDDFRQTELTPPDAWSADEVSQRLDALMDRLQATKKREQLQQQIDRRQDQIEELEPVLKQIEEKADHLRERIAALPDQPFENSTNNDALYWFIMHVQEWQKHNAAVQAIEEGLAAKQGEFRDQLEAFNALCEKYLGVSAEDAAQAKALFKKVEHQQKTLDAAENKISTQNDIIEDKKNTVDEWKQERVDIYENFDIPLGERAQIRQLLGRLDAFKTLRQEVHTAENRLAEKEQALKNHSRYADERAVIENITLDQAGDKLEAYAERAQVRDAVSEEITEIKTKITDAEGGQSLGNALKDREEALLDLKQLYDENLSAITGQLLIDQLKEELREQNRPQVFKEANKLFNKITKGKYKIDIDEGDEPQFFAYDTIKRTGKRLHELSTGTRIQLLLSVRLAFVETALETTVKLPILADELLANSDDVRAQAIIEALAAISKEGRQIFYFTAQADEVNKWKSFLAQTDNVGYKIYELTGTDQPDMERDDHRNIAPFSLRHEVPDPEGLSYEQYGQKIDLPSYHLMRHHPAELHLWYVLEDVDLLHAYLTKGINYWGQLKSFLDSKGEVAGMTKERVQGWKEKIKLLKRYQSLFQQGRPKLIDRAVLEDSGAVSNSFIDEASQKLEALDGNPASLLHALKRGEVSGFRTSKIEQLENYLIDHELIDPRPTLGKDIMETNIQAFISNLALSPGEADTFLGRIIQRN